MVGDGFATCYTTCYFVTRNLDIDELCQIDRINIPEFRSLAYSKFCSRGKDQFYALKFRSRSNDLLMVPTKNQLAQ